jgi:hypothetical protein
MTLGRVLTNAFGTGHLDIECHPNRTAIGDSAKMRPLLLTRQIIARRKTVHRLDY